MLSTDAHTRACINARAGARVRARLACLPASAPPRARGRGLGAYVNHAQIVLLPGPYENKDEIDGRYGPERNMNLDPGGRVIEIVSAGAAWFSGRGSTDGFGSELDLLRPTQAASADKATIQRLQKETQEQARQIHTLQVRLTCRNHA